MSMISQARLAKSDALKALTCPVLAYGTEVRARSSLHECVPQFHALRRTDTASYGTGLATFGTDVVYGPTRRGLLVSRTGALFRTDRYFCT
eukprot:3898579-Rhodomonas_salina.2